ncbi:MULTISPECIES: S26 family signal peptidase [unclassified Novosphingobium]|uniref:S26 family signal peptidase n=1 Tax=unclassified Novosphingobium TaxID=2644732 RepID=UPI0013576E45|nr:MULTISPECIES: S26 family signal peptidase [unclassified Novosphingobium]
MATRSDPARPRAPLSFGKKLAAIGALAVGALALQSLSHWGSSHALMINESESLPNWAFLVEAGRFPARGDYVIFNPGRDPLVIKYFGEHPSAFAKVAYGIPGDVVSRNGSDVLVNGHKVARLKPLTRRGDPLEAGPVGTVPHNCVFAGTDHKDGFDSRYAAIGFVCGHRIAGVGRPIL